MSQKVLKPIKLYKVVTLKKKNIRRSRLGIKNQVQLNIVR